jgi:hypothetical protein
MAAWYAKLDKSKYVAPRRLEYAATLHALGMPLAHAFLDGSLPVGALEAALSRAELAGAGVPAAHIEPKRWDTPEEQAVLEDPELRELSVAFTKYLTAQGFTEDMMWETVQDIRAKGGVK